MLAPAIKGCVGVAREVNFQRFVNVSNRLAIFHLAQTCACAQVFTKHWGCVVRPCKTNAVKLIPPVGQKSWPFQPDTFIVYKVRTLQGLEQIELKN